MTSGGHARSGPAPDPFAMHRGDRAASGWLRLTVPDSPPPPWPLGEQSAQEAEIWDDLWSRPPASAWPAYSLTREVASYARTLALYESAPQAALGTLLRRLADDLGLTVSGAARNQWLLPTPEAPIDATPVKPVRPSSPTHKPARERFRIVKPVDPALTSNSSQETTPA